MASRKNRAPESNHLTVTAGSGGHKLGQRRSSGVARDSRHPELFVLATGQDDNIGDVVLRREYFDRLRKLGRLHIFVGTSSADFLDGLRLHHSDCVYEELEKWHSAAWRKLIRAKVWFVDKPGELQLDSRTMRRQLKLVPLIVGIRLRKGQVLRLGMAMRAVDSLQLRRLRRLFRLSTETYWRDTDTSTAIGYGAVAPDWAFGWRAHEDSERQDRRPYIAVSYRGDRDAPSGRTLESLAELARNHSRRLVVVTQVRRDSQRSLELASNLGAELVPWPPGRSFADQEEVLRMVYRKSALVVSDRLHVLIVGMTEGAVPLCITDRGESKVERHLNAVGFRGSTARLDDDSMPIGQVLEGQIARGSEVSMSVRNAQERLEQLIAHLAVCASVPSSGG
jgi:hypothetical protein